MTLKTIEKEYDKGINKILRENKLPPTTFLLLAFSKDFYRTRITTLLEKMNKWHKRAEGLAGELYELKAKIKADNIKRQNKRHKL